MNFLSGLGKNAQARLCRRETNVEVGAPRGRADDPAEPGDGEIAQRQTQQEDKHTSSSFPQAVDSIYNAAVLMSCCLIAR